MSIKITLCLALLPVGLVGCAKHEASSKVPEVSTDPAVQAEASRKEMRDLPKAFQTPDYFKKNDPTPEATAKQEQQP